MGATRTRTDGIGPVDNSAARARYEQLTGLPLALLGVAFLAVYAWPILDPDLPQAGGTLWASQAL